jgi:hypothetical protein
VPKKNFFELFKVLKDYHRVKKKFIFLIFFLIFKFFFLNY